MKFTSDNFKNVALEEAFDFITTGDFEKALEIVKGDNDLFAVGIVNSLISKVKGDLKTSKLKLKEIEEKIPKTTDQLSLLIFEYTACEVSILLNEMSEIKSSLKKLSDFLSRMELITEKNLYWRAKIENLNGLVYLKEQNLGKADQYFKDALKKFTKINKKIEIANVLENTGEINRLAGKFDLAIKNHQESLEIRIKIGNNYDIVKSLNKIGTIYGMKGEMDKAIEYFLRSLEYVEKVGNILEKANILNNLGISHQLKGNNDQAINFFENAYSLFEEIGMDEKKGMVISNIGNIQLNNGLLNDALNSYEKSIKYLNQNVHKNELAIAYNNIGVIHKRQGNYNKARELFEKSLEFGKQSGNKTEIARTISNIGELLLLKGELANARDKISEALSVWEEINNKKQIARELNNLGIVLYRMNEYEKSREILLKSYEMRIKLNDLIELSDTLYNLIIVAIELEDSDFSKYLDHLEKLSKATNNKIINARFKVVKAIQLHNQERFQSFVEAQELYESVIHDDIVDSELTYMAIINLSDQLLDEFRLHRNEEIIEMIEYFNSLILDKAKVEKLDNLMVESLLLQFKFKLIQGEITQATEILLKAEKLAEEKNLVYSLKRIREEKEDFNRQLIESAKLLQQTEDLRERIQKTNLIEHLMTVANILKEISENKVTEEP